MSQAITPELRQWIVEQAQAGHSAESVLRSMKAAGWDEDVAIQAMEDTLRGHLNDQALGWVQSGNLAVSPSLSHAAYEQGEARRDRLRISAGTDPSRIRSDRRSEWRHREKLPRKSVLPPRPMATSLT